MESSWPSLRMYRANLGLHADSGARSQHLKQIAASEEGGRQEGVQGDLGMRSCPPEFNTGMEEGLPEWLCSLESLSSLPSGNAGAAEKRRWRGQMGWVVGGGGWLGGRWGVKQHYSGRGGQSEDGKEEAGIPRTESLAGVEAEEEEDNFRMCLETLCWVRVRDDS